MVATLVVKRVIVVIVLILIAWALTAYKDRVPESVRGFGARETATTSVR